MSQLRPRPTKQPSIKSSIDNDDSDDNKSSASSGAAPLLLPRQASSVPQQQQRGAISQTLAGTANLANLLPTSTLLAFQLLTPVFTRGGTCDAVTRPLTELLLAALSLSCLAASFTDSVRGAADGRVYYGIATLRGMYVFDCPDSAAAGLPDLDRFRIRIIDWVHAVMSAVVFGVVAARDKNVVTCLYPQPGHEVQEILDIVPVGIGVLCSLLFLVFPTTRHGIGYPVSPGK